MADSLVFIVDDDINILNVMKDILECLGSIRIKLFLDDSFLKDPELHELDLLIIDNHLGLNKSGIELAVEGSKAAFFPVLVISGYELSPEEEGMLNQLQVYDFIEKPMLSLVLRNRARLLIAGMRYTHQIIRDKQGLENRFWALLRNISGIYCIFTDINGNIIYSDNSFMKDVGYADFDSNESACWEINIKNFMPAFNPSNDDTRQEFMSILHDKNGEVVGAVKCFTWYINKNNHQYLTLAFPVMADDDKIGISLLKYYGNIIKNDREMVDIIKKVSKVGG